MIDKTYHQIVNDRENLSSDSFYQSSRVIDRQNQLDYSPDYPVLSVPQALSNPDNLDPRLWSTAGVANQFRRCK